MDSSQLSIYKEALEREIENKKYFLKQAHSAIESLATSDLGLVEDKDEWREFLKKPMFFPDRSDPIGLNLVSIEQQQRLKTSKEVLGIQQLNELEELVDFQRSLNSDLELFYSMLLRREREPTLREQEESVSRRNTKLFEILKRLIKEYIMIDISAPLNRSSETADEVWTMMLHLLNGENLNVREFRGATAGFYRMLLRSGLIENVDAESKSMDSNMYIKLIDFAENF